MELLLERIVCQKMFVEYPAGTVLTLADGKTRIKLG